MKCASRAWGELERGCEVLAPGELCFEGTGPVEKEFGVLALDEICFQGMQAVEKAVLGVGTG